MLDVSQVKFEAKTADLPGALWSSLEQHGSVPSPRRGSTIISSPDKLTLYLFGGLTFNSDDSSQVLDNNFYMYDLKSSIWTILSLKGDFPEPRYLHSFTFFKESVMIVFGGLSCENQIGVDSPIVFGDIHYVDLLDNYISKPFTANERPTP
jgi:hypothetical protein